MNDLSVTAPSIYRLLPDTADMIRAIQVDKYIQPGDISWGGALRRVATALLGGTKYGDPLYDSMADGQALPAGRVMAGAGSDKNVTWINCFVAPLLQDSMKTMPEFAGLGIMDCLSDVAYSMQMGGGVGTDFSPLRPEGAMVKRVNAPASGPIVFMDMWDSMCRTVMSAGYRRGAMMATLRCDHPDIWKFIEAKHTPGRLTMFNVSVLVTDAFMRAVEAGHDWELGHWEPSFTNPHQSHRNYPNPYRNNETCKWYVYEVVPARKLWDAIMQSTYKYAEPGVIFIDRINKLNNLYYCEYIQCTNPCGEQPLPPDQNCNLSHVNLSRCVVGTPFTDGCAPNWMAIENAAKLLVRMGDKVIELTPWPTERQYAEAQMKRRIGIGFTGLANMLMFMRMPYGNALSARMAGQLMAGIRDACYRESIELAKETEPFPAFDRDKYLASEFVKTLPEDIRQGVADHGIRNALLNTIAPVGTMSIAGADNSSSGIEPVFAARYKRKVLQPDNSFKEFIAEDFGFRVYANSFAGGDMDLVLSDKWKLHDYMVTTKDLTPFDHVRMQGEVQKYVDSSISKTINVPTDTDFNEFANVYSFAYQTGCKGCTTYRPVEDSGRGAILSVFDDEGIDTSDIPEADEEWFKKARLTLPAATLDDLHSALGMKPEPTDKVLSQSVEPRPRSLSGETYKLNWGDQAALYVTMNDVMRDGKKVPYEVFINTKSPAHFHWMAALTRMISAVMRQAAVTGNDVRFIPKELSEIHSQIGGEWIDGHYVPSELALLGATMMEHFRAIGYVGQDEWLDFSGAESKIVNKQPEPQTRPIGRECPQCHQLTVIRKENCDECTNCTYNKCS